MSEGNGSYSLKQAALRDLIKLALHHHGGPFIDRAGRVASQVREACGLPDTKSIGNCMSNTLLLMEKDGSVDREMNERRTRTFSLALLQTLTTAEVAALEKRQERCLELFVTPSPEEGGEKTGQESLVETCQLAYLELQDYAAKPNARRWGDMVAINVAGVLKAMGLPREEQRRVRYYLKQLGLVRSHSKVDDGGHLWWWTVEKRELDVDALGRLIEERPYEDSTPQGSTKAGPVTVRKVEPVTPASSQEPPVEVVTEVEGDTPDEGDRLAALVAIVEGLVEEKNKLEKQVRDLKATHYAEKEELNAKISRFEQQLAQRSTAGSRADVLIAQFGRAASTD